MFQAHGFWIRDCKLCGHRFAEIPADENHVRQIYDDSYFNGGGAGYNDYLSEKDLLVGRGQTYAKLLKKYASTGEMLDVGAAAGFLLKGFTDSGWQGQGIEPNANMARFARENLGLSVKVGTLETLPTDKKFDLISMIQVVAHFYDVPSAFENAVKLLKKDGFLLIESWNRESLTARFFGQNWHEYSPPSVLHWFSPRSLSEFAGKYGFEKIANGRPSKWISGAHAKSLLKHKLGNSPLSWPLKLVPDKLNFPYPAEDLFWLLLRKSGQ
jgi:SAM-dependent methyltransferase